MMKKCLILLSIFIFFIASNGLIISLNYAQAQGGAVNVSARVEAICGNGRIEEDEQCDGDENLAGQTCQGLGYDGGTLGCKAGYCTFDVSGCTRVSPPGGGGAVYIPPPTETKVILQGKAYPAAAITVLQDGKVATTKKADSQANFRVEITNLTAGTYTFGLWAEDKKGRKSITFSFTTTIKEKMTTTIGGIFIPPTIELEKTRVDRGETMNIFGQTAPKSEITISVESPEITKKTEADEEGGWDYPFDTSPLTEGSHIARAKAETPGGLLSSYSKVLSFYVGKFGVEEICPKADFNKDGKTNLVDFSIMLYWWGKYNPCVDSNQNGIVDLADFSILMYWWTG